jgi:hypothetical protein
MIANVMTNHDAIIWLQRTMPWGDPWILGSQINRKPCQLIAPWDRKHVIFP